MKLLVSVILILFAFNLINAINVNVRPTPNKQDSSKYVTIVPMGGYCSDSPFGQGFYLPLGECININNVNAIFSLNNNQLQVQKNCNNHTKDEIDVSQSYPMNQCIYSFNPFDYQFSYSVVIKESNAIPEEAIQTNYYYSTKTTDCVGPYFSVFFTNGFSNVYNKYECINGVPYYYSCQADGECTQYNLSNGCGLDIYPLNSIC